MDSPPPTEWRVRLQWRQQLPPARSQVADVGGRQPSPSGRGQPAQPAHQRNGLRRVSIYMYCMYTHSLQ